MVVGAAKHVYPHTRVWVERHKRQEVEGCGETRSTLCRGHTSRTGTRRRECRVCHTAGTGEHTRRRNCMLVLTCRDCSSVISSDAFMPFSVISLNIQEIYRQCLGHMQRKPIVRTQRRQQAAFITARFTSAIRHGMQNMPW